MYRRAFFPSSLLGMAVLLLTAGNAFAGNNNILLKRDPPGTGLKVSIPIRFVPGDENFFERIGVDFDRRMPTRTSRTIFSVPDVTTTVIVPDDGIVLMGGIKRLREGRNQPGVPILSKIPYTYINRLFKNVGIARETQSLMIMVTPRIIIEE